MNEDKVNICVVLDRSGSMDSVRQATVDGFNEFLNGQRVGPGNASLTLIQFDDVIETVYSDIDVKEIPSLTLYTFVPRGMTALYDAVGTAISQAEEKSLAGRGGKNLIVIITDGGENISKRFNKHTISDLINKRRGTGWDFVFIGANQDAWAVGTGLGIAGGYTFTFDSTPAGTKSMFAGLSGSTRAYRSASVAGQAAPTNFFDPENQNAVDGSKTNVSKSK